jgi:hypothetical protein
MDIVMLRKFRTEEDKGTDCFRMILIGGGFFTQVGCGVELDPWLLDLLVADGTPESFIREAKCPTRYVVI